MKTESIFATGGSGVWVGANVGEGVDVAANASGVGVAVASWSRAVVGAGKGVAVDAAPQASVSEASKTMMNSATGPYF